MIEKVNPSHPDKVADRIAGAIVDLAYKTENDPKVAVEVLIGHGKCHVIIETTADLNKNAIKSAIKRIAGNVKCDIVITSKMNIYQIIRKMGIAVEIMVFLKECR